MTAMQPGSGRALADAEVGSGWGWFVTLGVALLVLGVLAFGNLLAATLASVLLVGAMMIVGAVAQVIRAFQVRGWGATSSGCSAASSTAPPASSPSPIWSWRSWR